MGWGHVGMGRRAGDGVVVGMGRRGGMGWGGVGDGMEWWWGWGGEALGWGDVLGMEQWWGWGGVGDGTMLQCGCVGRGLYWGWDGGRVGDGDVVGVGLCWDGDVLLMSGIRLLQNGLWVSKDFGERWEQIHRAVCLAKW